MISIFQKSHFRMGLLLSMAVLINGGVVYAKSPVPGDLARLAAIYKNYRGIYMDFAMACKVYPYVHGRSEPEVLYLFGRSLFGAGWHNEQLELEGLAYMDRSGLLEIEYADEQKESTIGSKKGFSEYCDHYIRYKDCFNTYYDKYGMLFIGDGVKILAPSRAHWNAFKKEKLDTVKPSPASLFDIYEKHDLVQIHLLQKKHNLSFVTGSMKGNPFISIYSCSGNQYQKIAEMVVKHDNHETVIDTIIESKRHEQALKPVFVFMQDALSRCHDGGSVHSMFRNLDQELPNDNQPER